MPRAGLDSRLLITVNLGHWPGIFHPVCPASMQGLPYYVCLPLESPSPGACNQRALSDLFLSPLSFLPNAPVLSSLILVTFLYSGQKEKKEKKIKNKSGSQMPVSVGSLGSNGVSRTVPADRTTRGQWCCILGKLPGNSRTPEQARCLK